MGVIVADAQGAIDKDVNNIEVVDVQGAIDKTVNNGYVADAQGAIDKQFWELDNWVYTTGTILQSSAGYIFLNNYQTSTLSPSELGTSIKPVNIEFYQTIRSTDGADAEFEVQWWNGSVWASLAIQDHATTADYIKRTKYFTMTGNTETTKLRYICRSVGGSLSINAREGKITAWYQRA